MLALFLASATGCITKKSRRFSASCGQSAECESGLCYNGFCTSSCTSGATCSSGVCIEKVCQPPDEDYDHDGLTNSWEAKHGLNAEKADSDGDGIPDKKEVGNVLAPVDSNGDGVIDALQSNLNDSDADCMVDAFDSLPGKIDTLPDSATICGSGVCAGKTGEVTVVCTPADPTATGAVVAGCKGCSCKSSSIADFQSPETWCDGLDNDCNGKTDESATLGGQPLGGGCVASHGICTLSSKVGKIECKNKIAICSTDGGSESAGTSESCNLQDDDCNGTTDDGFLFKGTAVGKSCEKCGFKGPTCPDGSQMNAALVGCSADGQSADCLGLPFDTSFTSIAVGAPEPRDIWSMGWRETHSKVTVFSGKVAAVAAGGMVDRDEEWFLKVDDTGVPMPWQRAQQQDPKARAGAAIASDPTSDLLWLIGGVDGQDTLQTEVFSSPEPNAWNSESTPGASHAVPALPSSSLTTPVGKAAPPAFVLNFNDQRALLIFDRHYSRPLWHRVGEATGDWVTAAGDDSQSSTEVLCAAQTPDHQVVFVRQADGSWLRFVWDGLKVTASVQLSAASAVVHPGAQCVIDNANYFHALGGYSGSTVIGDHLVASIVGTGNDAVVSGLFQVTSTAEESAAFARAGGIAAWSLSLSAVVLAGGESNDGTGRYGRPDVSVWHPDTHGVARADKPSPRARFGHAGGYWPQQNAYCIAGGLTAELPDGGTARVVPIDDAWCVNKDGVWTQKVSSGVRYAYGAAAIDTAGQRLVLTGGLALQGSNFSEVSKLWSMGLLSDGTVVAALAPTATLQTVAFGNGFSSAGTWSIVASPDAPELAAPAFAYDSKRNRLILVDGYDSSGEVPLFKVLDLKTLAWTDLASQLPKANDAKPFLPMPRYGALALYDAQRDIIAVIGGSLRHPNGSIGYDIVNGPVGLPVSSCMATGFVPFDVSTTLANPQFVPQPLPLFTSLTNPTKDGTLLSPWFGGPVFAPVIYDDFGGHAWLAVPDAPPPVPGDGKLECGDLGVAKVAPLHMNHQLSLDIGACGGQLAAKPSLQALEWAPSALFSSSFQYVSSDRSAWIAGGLEPDGAVSSEVARLGQTCKAVP